MSRFSYVMGGLVGLGLLPVLAAPSFAQDAGGPGGPGGRPAARSMGRPMHLTEDQRKKLDEVQDDFLKQLDSLEAAQLKLMQEHRRLMQKHRQQLRSILTPEQSA